MPGWARPFFPAVPVYSFTFANTATMPAPSHSARLFPPPDRRHSQVRGQRVKAAQGILRMRVVAAAQINGAPTVGKDPIQIIRYLGLLGWHISSDRTVMEDLADIRTRRHPSVIHFRPVSRRQSCSRLIAICNRRSIVPLKLAALSPPAYQRSCAQACLADRPDITGGRGDLGRPSAYFPLTAGRARQKLELLHKCFPSQRAFRPSGSATGETTKYSWAWPDCAAWNAGRPTRRPSIAGSCARSPATRR